MNTSSIAPRPTMHSSSTTNDQTDKDSSTTPIASQDGEQTIQLREPQTSILGFITSIPSRTVTFTTDTYTSCKNFTSQTATYISDTYTGCKNFGSRTVTTVTNIGKYIANIPTKCLETVIETANRTIKAFDFAKTVLSHTASGIGTGLLVGSAVGVGMALVTNPMIAPPLLYFGATTGAFSGGIVGFGTGIEEANIEYNQREHSSLPTKSPWLMPETTPKYIGEMPSAPTQEPTTEFQTLQPASPPSYAEATSEQQGQIN